MALEYESPVYTGVLSASPVDVDGDGDHELVCNQWAFDVGPPLTWDGVPAGTVKSRQYHARDEL